MYAPSPVAAQVGEASLLQKKLWRVSILHFSNVLNLRACGWGAMGEPRSNLLEVNISHEGLRLALVYRDEVLESSRKVSVRATADYSASAIFGCRNLKSRNVLCSSQQD